MEGGRIQVQNCTFDAVATERKPGNAYSKQGTRVQPPAILLAPGVRHAIVSGNNGYYGVRVDNEIGERAIIRDNEPYRPKE